MKSSDVDGERIGKAEAFVELSPQLEASLVKYVHEESEALIKVREARALQLAGALIAAAEKRSDRASLVTLTRQAQPRGKGRGGVVSAEPTQRRAAELLADAAAEFEEVEARAEAELWACRDELLDWVNGLARSSVRGLLVEKALRYEIHRRDTPPEGAE